MAYTTINKSSDHFNTKLYTGTGSSNAQTGIGFQPDFTWIKSRSNTYSHSLTDAVRGVTKKLASNNSNAEYTSTTEITSFDSDGFTVGTDAGVNNSSSTFASWNWKANGSGSSNSDGSISSTVSANTTAGFSIVKYTGTGSAATVGHGLGVVPKFLITKALNDGRSWLTYNATDGSGKGIDLNGTGASNTNSAYWNNTTPTTSVVSLGGNVQTSGSYDYIMYCFAEKKGFSKFGSYTGNGNVDGAFVYTGFKPAVLIVKTNTTTGGWQIYDSKRNTSNPTSKFLVPSSNAAETSGSNDIDFLSNGFKTRTTANPGTTDGFIYMAFAEAPLVGSNNVPCTAR